MPRNIKTMQLYPRAERILADLNASGYAGDTPLPLDVLTRFDQLHYHGTQALDAAVSACGIAAGDKVLEVGSGWGGCARYVAHVSGADVTAIELQSDYDNVARQLTARAGLADNVAHINADFLSVDLPTNSYDHAVSWLALFHIPRRKDYLEKISNSLKPGGFLYAEDLFQIQAPRHDEADDFNRHLFPNSLVDVETYKTSLHSAGFELLELQDMTEDWTDFTATRLAAFHATRAEYEAVHGAHGYAAIETFYSKMAGYFARGLVGGLRFSARRET